MVKSSEEWDSHYAKIFDEMRIDQSTFETINVRILNVDLDKVVQHQIVLSSYGTERVGKIDQF